MPIPKHTLHSISLSLKKIHFQILHYIESGNEKKRYIPASSFESSGRENFLHLLNLNSISGHILINLTQKAPTPANKLEYELTITEMGSEALEYYLVTRNLQLADFNSVLHQKMVEDRTREKQTQTLYQTTYFDEAQECTI
jgi:hypothetical protein